jgi:DNA-binding response OmpR family regulator
MPRRIAIVEDEAEIAALVEYNLARNGFQSRIFPGRRETIADLREWRPDLIILDVMLPETDGFELCRQIRRDEELAGAPVLFVTARSEEADRVLGLELGGDDYIVKPFSPRELVARVKAHLRRSSQADALPQIESGPLRIDRSSHRAYLHGRELSLTGTEFRLLEFLVAHAGRAFSRDQLLNEVWSEQRFVTPRTVDVHVRRLREQIEEQPEQPRLLTTLRGVGYRLEKPETA